jgi:hypothetical protein
MMRKELKIQSLQFWVFEEKTAHAVITHEFREKTLDDFWIDEWSRRIVGIGNDPSASTFSTGDFVENV